MRVRALSDASGSTMVEFALSVGVVLALFFGVFYASMALYADHFTANAAKAAARYAMVRGSTWNGAPCSSVSTLDCTATSRSVTNFVQSIIPPGISASEVAVSTTWPGTTPIGATCDTVNGANSPYCAVRVEVQYTFNISVPFLPPGHIVFSNFSTAPITQ